MAIRRGLILPALSVGRGGSSRLSRAEIFDLLQNRRRRFALHYLIQQDGSVTLSDLSEHVAAWETNTSVDSLPPEARQRVYVSLRQSHLPRLDRDNVVSFNESDGTVELAGNAPAMQIYLETVPEGDISWAHYYLGVSVVSAGFVILVWQNIRPFSDYELIVWLLIVVAFAGSGVLHHLYLRRHRLGTQGPPPSEI